MHCRGLLQFLDLALTLRNLSISSERVSLCVLGWILIVCGLEMELMQVPLIINMESGHLQHLQWRCLEKRNSQLLFSSTGGEGHECRLNQRKKQISA